jgi:wyosine [tRNA(Phe)-imidazoG37] synthetase (radical SAM superfamily)
MQGFRQQAQPTTKDKFRSMDTELKNLQMATRMTQMMLQQLLQSNKNMGEDLSKLFQIVNELQYKTIAIQKTAGLNQDALAAEANNLRLKDFQEASDKQDAAEGFEVIDTVEDDSVVILTSTTSTTPDAGIFRSRIKLSDAGVPDLINGLRGKQVGTKVAVKLNGTDHEVELLGIRRPKRQEQAAAEQGS